MKRTYKSSARNLATAALATIIVLVSSHAHAATKQQEEAMKALPDAIFDHLTSTYLCQDNIFGKDTAYEVTKQHAKDLFAAMLKDRNKAVLTLNDFEEKMKRDYPNPGEALRKNIKAKENKLSKDDIDWACISITKESRNKIEVLEAKAGILE